MHAVGPIKTLALLPMLSIAAFLPYYYVATTYQYKRTLPIPYNASDILRQECVKHSRFAFTNLSTLAEMLVTEHMCLGNRKPNSGGQ